MKDNIFITKSPIEATYGTKKASGMYRLPSAQGIGQAPNLYGDPDTIFTDQLYRDVVSWSRLLFLNGEIVKGGVNLRTVYSVGSHLAPRSLCPDLGARVKYDAYLDNFKRSATLEGHSLNDLLNLVTQAIDVDGDCFLYLTRDDLKRPSLQLLTADRVHGVPPSSSKFNNYLRYTVKRGVVRDRKGRSVAYVVDGYNVVSAQSIIHCKDFELYSGSRGLPLFAHAISSLLQIDEIHGCELHAAQIASSVAMTINSDAEIAGQGISTSGGNAAQEVKQDPSSAVSESFAFRSGSVLYFKAGSGEKVECPTFSRPSPDYRAFELRLGNGALIGASIPYQLINPDEATGTIMRSSLTVFDKSCKDRSDLMKGIIQRVVTYVLSYGIANDGLPSTENFDLVHITTPPPPSVDLGRDRTARLQEYLAGVRTLDSFAEDEGLTVAEYVDRIAEHKAMMLKAEREAMAKYGVEPQQDTKI